jgi:hypothetical protein
MNLPVRLLLLVACATPAAAAEVWSCTDKKSVGDDIMHFEISPPDVIMSPVVSGAEPTRFHIVQNDDHSLVEANKDDPLIVWTIAINKVTGEFGLTMLARRQACNAEAAFSVVA